MSYIIDEMINEKVENINNNIIYLEKEEDEEIKKALEEIKKLTDKIKKKYSYKIEELQDERSKLSNVKYLAAGRSSEFIAFLVSSIENKSYYKINVPINYKGKYIDYHHHDEIGEYTGKYIVCGLTDDKTKVEIKENETYTEEDLNKEYEHFFRLFHYNEEIPEEELYVNYLADTPVKYISLHNDLNRKINSCISGEENNYKFTYIRYFIERIVEYRLRNQEYNDLFTSDYIYFLRKFVKEYKQDEETLKKSLKDPSFY